MTHPKAFSSPFASDETCHESRLGDLCCYVFGLPCPFTGPSSRPAARDRRGRNTPAGTRHRSVTLRHQNRRHPSIGVRLPLADLTLRHHPRRLRLRARRRRLAILPLHPRHQLRPHRSPARWPPPTRRLLGQLRARTLPTLRVVISRNSTRGVILPLRCQLPRRRRRPPLTKSTHLQGWLFAGSRSRLLRARFGRLRFRDQQRPNWPSRDAGDGPFSYDLP